MSHYKNLIVATNEAQTYLYSINKFGEVVQYALDKDGNATGFCTGKPADVFLEAIRQRYPAAEFDLCHNPGPWDLCPAAERWRDVLAVLQGKLGTRRTETRVYCRLRPTMCAMYLKGNWYYHPSRVVLTDLAIAYDTKKDQEAAARRGKDEDEDEKSYLKL